MFCKGVVFIHKVFILPCKSFLMYNICMSKQKKIVLFLFFFLLVVLLLIVFSLYKRNKNTKITEPEVTQESVQKDLQNFVPEPERTVDPKQIQEDLSGFQVSPENKVSDEDILNALNDPNITPLPYQNR